MPAKETCGPIPKTVPTVTASSTTTGETTTSDSLTINTSMATALNGTTNASNGSIQTHTVMTGPRVTTTSIMPSIVNASSDVIRETTASSSLSTAMTPLPLSSTVTSQAMTIASDSTTGAEMISNPTLKSDETSSAITQGETTTSDSLTINTSMATALNGTTNASNGSIQTHTVMTGPRVTTTSIMPSIVYASSDVIRETTASSSLSTAMTPLPLSSTVTSQAMTIASDSTTGAEMISNPTLKSDETSSAITQGETTTSDSLTINTSMATALNGTTNASNGSIQTHTVMTGPRVTTTSIMPSIVNASSDVIRETTASSSLSTAMTPLPLSSTVTSQAMTIASDSTTGAEMISNPTLKSDETSSAITQVFIIPMQFSLNKTFMKALSNTSSEDYQQYHTNISKVLNETYTRFLPGFQWASIKAFGPGSIIVSYDVGSSNEDFTLKNLQNAKHNIIESLQHLNVNNSSFVTYFGKKFMHFSKWHQRAATTVVGSPMEDSAAELESEA
ncbi:mucin-22-like [Protopterus annectens]|uniref:mucin-22-like n=1 Tax=Protopterus annectens TaxID=7888 RepID=UPI001CFB080C|nr:mucin-22-like [Protopterus annectens]